MGTDFKMLGVLKRRTGWSGLKSEKGGTSEEKQCQCPSILGWFHKLNARIQANSFDMF